MGALKPEYGKSREEVIEVVPYNINRLLDVGCNVGSFGKKLKLERPNLIVHGIELDEAAATIAKQVLDDVYIGDIESIILELPDGHYDTICFNDVLEHLVDPYGILKKISKKLNNDGIIVASIPNIRFFKAFRKIVWGKDWDYEDQGVMDKTHLRFFTYKSIIKMFVNNGFEIISIKGINKSKSLKPYLFNIITFGGFGADTAYQQFLIKAKISS